MRDVAAARPAHPLGFLADRLAGITPLPESAASTRASSSGETTAAWLGQHLWPCVREALTAVLLSEVRIAATAIAGTAADEQPLRRSAEELLAAVADELRRRE